MESAARSSFYFHPALSRDNAGAVIWRDIYRIRSGIIRALRLLARPRLVMIVRGLGLGILPTLNIRLVSDVLRRLGILIAVGGGSGVRGRVGI